MGLTWLLAAGGAPGVYYAYQNSDGMGKGIVLFLIFGSMAVWTVMLSKGAALRRARKMSMRFLSYFGDDRRNVSSTSLLRAGSENESPVAEVYNAGVEKLLEFYDKGRNTGIISSSGESTPIKLSDAQYNAIEAVLESEVSSQIEKLETNIGFLATVVSLAPFCGLFGTVWGVMMAFCGIAAAGKSDFTALAPGVAGALLTTVAGLIVAIPSLVGYNMLTGEIRSQTVMMDNFTEEFLVRIKLEQLALDRQDRGV